MVSRRNFLKFIAAAAGALGFASLSRRFRSVIAQTELPPNAKEALYYVPGGKETADCLRCHTTPEPSRTLYCHIPHKGNYVKCQLCPKGCLISEGRRGDCRVRENRGGKLYTMVYGNPCAVHNDPIEKKPFYHFLPGTMALSLATAGCNLHCLYCQNWSISQVPPEQTENYELSPEEIVMVAEKLGSSSIAFTYTEPTIFYEYMSDIARLARPKGIRCIVISAGYINPEPLRQLCKIVDAIKIDFKGFSEEFYRKVCFGTLKPVLNTMKIIREEGVHLEIVNLVVPTLNDSEEQIRGLCRWIVENLGPDVPTHFSRFFPQYKLTHLPPTPVSTLEMAREIAVEEGIKFAYVGNVPGHKWDNTYCPRCGKAIITRMGFNVVEYHLKSGKCEYCGESIPGVWV
jgi:pyruvate formate lyase activating enzyme